MQAALTTFGVTPPADANIFYSLGGIFDAAIFIFYRNSEPVTLFCSSVVSAFLLASPELRLRILMMEVLKGHSSVGCFHSTLDDPDYSKAIDALMAGEIDVLVIPQQDLNRVEDASASLVFGHECRASRSHRPDSSWAEARGARRGLLTAVATSPIQTLTSRFPQQIPGAKDLYRALQYLLLEAMREVHWPAGTFNRLGEFPAEQPNDLPLSPTAEVFYRSGPTFWQRYTTFLALVASQPDSILYHSDHPDADSPNRLCPSDLQMVLCSSHRSIAPGARKSGTRICGEGRRTPIG